MSNEHQPKESDMRPTSNNILIKMNVNKTTKGGLHVPENYQEQEQYAEVIAIGPGRITDSGTLVEVRVKVGDHVVVGINPSMAEVTHKGEKYILLREHDIVIIIDTPEPN